MKLPLTARSGENKKPFWFLASAIWLSFLWMAVFLFHNRCLAEEAANNLIISEVLIGGDSASEEFVELYNPSDSDIDLQTLPLAFHVVNSKNSDSAKTLNFTNSLVLAKSYYLIASKDYASKNNVAPDATYSTNGNSLVADGAVYISRSKNKKEDILDYLGWGENNYFDEHIAPAPSKGKSLERIAPDKNAWQESCETGGTPGKENSKKEDCNNISGNNADGGNEGSGDNQNQNQKSKYADRVLINEIYPAPNTKTGEKEFVEITHRSGEGIDFSKWCLEDETEHKKGDSGKCKKFEDVKTMGDFTVFYGTFSLNNDSGGDTVYLFDGDKNLVDSRSYAATKAQQAYAFDGSAWRWTSQPTPGEENQFDKIPQIKIKKEDNVFKDMWTHLSVAVEDQNKDTKFTWDFGDGHKSYLQDTKHKYTDTGTYNCSLYVHDKKIEETLEFSINVKKYKAPKIRIIRFSANPKGSDTENEFIILKNASKKKINLKGWSIATGWKNLYNHPIRDDFKIKPGKSKKLTRGICAFTLANTKDKLELRGPDGKTVQKIKYDHGKTSITEDEIYQKNKKSWEWIMPPDITPKKNTPPKTYAPPKTGRPDATPTETTTTNHPMPQEYLGKYSTSLDWQNKISVRNNLVNYNLQIKFALAENPSRVAGVATARNIYLPPHRHWLVVWLDNLWMKINFTLNHFINSAQEN